MVAFRATLEELEDADLLLHIIDISNPRYEEQIKSVEKILADLNLQNTPTIRALNKIDRVSPQTCTRLSRKLKGIAISARSKATLLPLIVEMEKIVERKVTDYGFRNIQTNGN
jgi:GTP-binding protein HflX